VKSRASVGHNSRMSTDLISPKSAIVPSSLEPILV
jgi:hypothetical protein